MTITHTVLCTNGMLSKTLAVVRSLGESGVRVIVGEKIRFHASGFSKYASKTLVYPDPVKSRADFLAWLKKTILEEKVTMLFPMDDDTMSVVIENQDALSKHCLLSVPSVPSYDIAADKGSTVKHAITTGVPCPKSVEMSFKHIPVDTELFDLVRDMTYPLVLKPRFSSGSRGLRIVTEPQELLHAYCDIHQIYPNPIIQELIPAGTKYDVCLLYGQDHQYKASFIQKQLRNYPLEKGPSTVHESVDYPQLIQLAQKLLDPLKWQGVADVEFMIDPRDGKPKLLEINPRFWSSLHLSIRCGVNFPRLMFEDALGGQVFLPGMYRTGIIGRALLPGDILHYLSNPKRHKMKPSFWDFSLPDDTISIKDPFPVIGFFASALRYVFDYKMWKFVVRK